MSLQIHPDRVADNEKEEATEKFKVLTKIHGVLVDAKKKKLFDQQGIIDDDSDTENNWQKLWREFYKPITTTDIENFHQNYIGKSQMVCASKWMAENDWIHFIGSEMEERDVLKAYEHGLGCIDFMMESVPFMRVEDEPRIIKLVNGMYKVKVRHDATEWHWITPISFHLWPIEIRLDRQRYRARIRIVHARTERETGHAP